ncbi:MAG: alpha/beta hydrolase-fold protein [Chitinophagales bacterium]|nr:esterase family protein [Bacteroidota bacterium]MCB9042502.1 esterase family protein [Chitinophagales bacterium]
MIQFLRDIFFKHTLNIHSWRQQNVELSSKNTGSTYTISLFLPVKQAQNITFLLLNDGQDSVKMNLLSILEKFSAKKLHTAFAVAAIHAANRMQDYGWGSEGNLYNHGKKAPQYRHFILEELLPYLQKNFQAAAANHCIAGFSLGGISALDIAWQSDSVFDKVGVFSGALWWRKTRAASSQPDQGRLVIDDIFKSQYKPNLQFWFQAGTEDETDDRNHNGIIDAIDDTLDTCQALICKAYRPFYDVQYLEIPQGKHDIATWAAAMPAFLQWAFGKK